MGQIKATGRFGAVWVAVQVPGNLGFFRSGDREFAQYPGMVFRLGPAMRERRAAVHKALKDTDFDVMVNPKYIVQTKRRPFVRTVTVQVAGYGGHLVFEQPSEE